MQPSAFGSYRVVRPIGQGGMGRVFEVEDPALPGRRLALKLLPEPDRRPGLRARFAREAQLLARVHHPGVVRIHASGEAPEGPWLVMDLIEGRTLAEALEAEGPFPPGRAVEVALGVAEALAAVHDAGVLHRDLKPENVLLRPDGRPVLIDLGLARAADLEQLTRTGTLLGTPMTMAPEQVDGSSPERLDTRVDVWGLGTLLYTLLTGELPFSGAATMLEMLARIRRGEPDWGPIPSELAPVLRRALAKRPEDRQPDARAFANELGGRRAAPWRPPWLATVGLAGLLVIALLAVWVGRGAPPAPVVEREPQVAPRPLVGVAPPPRRAPRSLVRLQPPGVPGVALAWWEPGALITLGDRTLARWDWPPAERPAPSRVWAFESTIIEADLVRATGRVIAYTDGQLWTLDTRSTGAEPVRLTADVPREAISHLAVSVDGARIAFVREGRVQAFALDGLRAEGIAAPDLDGAMVPLWLRDGTLLVSRAGQIARDSPAEFRVLRLPELHVFPRREGGPEKLDLMGELTAMAEDGQGAVWAGDGRGMLSIFPDLAGEQPPRIVAGTGVKDPINTAHDITISAVRTFDRGGRRMAVTASRGNTEGPGELRLWELGADWWHDVAGVGAWPRPLHTVDVSPDGEWLVVGHGGGVEVWKIAALREAGSIVGSSRYEAVARDVERRP